MAKRFQGSFTAGELDPKLHGRVDLAKYQTGASRLLNFQILPFGGVSNRAGTEFVGPAGNEALPIRLIDFQLSGTDTCVLEFGDFYMRVIRNGEFIAGDNAGLFPGRPEYAISTPFSWQEVNELVVQQINDVLKITVASKPPHNLSRFALNDWRLSLIETAPVVNGPTDLVVVVNTRPLAPDASESYYPLAYQYTVTSIDENTGREGLPQAYFTALNDLFLRGFSNDVKFKPVAGARQYRIYKDDKGIGGLIGIVSGTAMPGPDGYLAFRDTNFTPDLTQGAPVPTFIFNGPGLYPRASTIFQQRSVYGGPQYKPNRIDLSQSSDYDNFDTSVPTKASDAIVFALAARKRQDVLFFVPVEDLIVFTVSGEWRVRGTDDGTLTPSSIDARQQSSYGCAPYIPPLLVQDDIVFVQAKGQMVRSIAYDFGQNKYRGIDMSLLSRHLMRGRSIVRMAYADVPFSSLYFVMSDGAMLVCTYLKDQEVLGWSEVTTDGIFEDVCVVAEGQEDVPYFVVRRAVAGRQRRYIERQHSRTAETPAEGFFVDCGLEYAGVATQTVSGLGHLEGRSIAAVADGKPVRNLVVSGGAITLPFAASRIIAGLPYDSVLLTLPIDVGNPMLVGELRNVTKVNIAVEKTAGIFYRTTEAGNFEEYKPSTTRGEKIINGLFTGTFEARTDGAWDKYGRVEVRASLLPVTVLSVTPEFKAGGDSAQQSYTGGQGGGSR